MEVTSGDDASSSERQVHVMVRVRPQLISEVAEDCCAAVSKVRFNKLRLVEDHAALLLSIQWPFPNPRFCELPVLEFTTLDAAFAVTDIGLER